MVQGSMALSLMRRGFPWILIAGLLALVTVVPALPAGAGVNTWTSARLYGGTVYGLAASPANPSIVLAGTGGAGVFRSTDGGVSWHRSSSGMPHDTTVFTFAFAPSVPSTVFAATYASGVYRSTDAGRSWVRITSSIDVGSFYYIAVDPSNAARLFIGSASGLWRSTSGGASWTLLTWPAGDGIAGEAVAIAPSDPQVVYVVGSSMLRSADGGMTWTNMAPVTEAASVWVDPGDANTLLVGGMDGVYRSTDGGASWHPVATVAVNDVVSRLVPDPVVPNRFWAGTYASGLFRSDDGGTTWHSYNAGLPAKRWVRGITFGSAGVLCALTQFGVFRRAQTASSWTPSSSGITGSEVNSLAYAPGNSAVLYAGLQGQGLFRSTDSGKSWSYAGLRGQNVNSVAVSPTRASTIWAATLTSVRRSRDGGTTWVKQFAVPDDAPTAVAVARSSPSTLYVTTYQSGVYHSGDGGSTWHRLTLPGDVVAFCILIDPANASRIWVGTRFDGIVRSTDGGATWTSGRGSQPSGYDAVSLAIDPHNHKRLYAAIEAESGGGVYVSSDSGRTWSRSSGGAAPASADVVAADPSTGGRIYAGSDDPAALGVYRSTDDGVSWRNVSAGLSTRDPRSLVVQPAGTIHLGTTAFGGGSGGGIFNYTP
jgi:photosystem II stability/assembly factor-like uncharacterized protein